jgi:magnesium transporter
MGQAAAVIVDCAVYERGKREPEGSRPSDDGAFTWIGLHEPTEAEFEQVTADYDLHPLAVEDAIKAHQRPKIEIYGDSLFVVLKTAVYDDQREEVGLGDIMLFVGERFIVAVRHGQHRALGEVRAALEADPDHLAQGPSAVLHAILDRVVDDYEQVVDGLDVDIDQIEHEVFSNEQLDRSARIFGLKREVVDFRRAVRPLMEPLQALEDGRVRVVDGDLRHSFRDVRDHVLRVVDRIEGLDAILTDALNANLAQVGVRQNEDMRKISAWVAIAAVPTMVAGIYGMNFTHMPELDERWAYPTVLLALVVACTSLYLMFKRRGWL